MGLVFFLWVVFALVLEVLTVLVLQHQLYKVLILSSRHEVVNASEPPWVLLVHTVQAFHDDIIGESLRLTRYEVFYARIYLRLEVKPDLVTLYRLLFLCMCELGVVLVCEFGNEGRELP